VVRFETSFTMESSISKDGHDFADLNVEVNLKDPALQVCPCTIVHL